MQKSERAPESVPVPVSKRVPKEETARESERAPESEWGPVRELERAPVRELERVPVRELERVPVPKSEEDRPPSPPPESAGGLSSCRGRRRGLLLWLLFPHDPRNWSSDSYLMIFLNSLKSHQRKTLNIITNKTGNR